MKTAHFGDDTWKAGESATIGQCFEGHFGLDIYKAGKGKFQLVIKLEPKELRELFFKIGEKVIASRPKVYLDVRKSKLASAVITMDLKNPKMT